MTYTLGQITHKVASALQILSDGKATGGSTTTIVDTSLRTEADDYWNFGSAWVWYDAGGLSADPEYSFSVISDFTASSDTITLRDALPSAVSSGDKYSICRRIGNDAWIDVIIQKVNDALRAVGPIPQVDTTTIDIASNQTEYGTIPITANMDLRQVFLQTNKDANDNLWVELFNWYVDPGTPGNAGTLVLPAQESAGYGLKLVYMDYHPEMQIAADVMSDHVPLDRVVMPAVLDCLYWMKRKNKGSDEWDALIDRYEFKAQQVEAMQPIHKPKRAGRVNLVNWRERDTRPGRWYPGDRNPR